MKYILLIAILFSNTTFAGLWPIVTSVSKRYSTVTIVQQLVDAGPSVDVIPANNLYVLGGYTHGTGSNVNFYPIINQSTSSKPGKTESEIAVELYNTKGGNMNSFSPLSTWGNSDYPYDCVGYAMSDTTISGQNHSHLQSFPGGCTRLPPSDQWCTITSPEIILDHGTISLQNTEGDQAKNLLSLNCSTAASYTFHLITDDTYVYLQPSGKSEIKVNNQILGSKIDLPTGTSSLTISDMLTGVTTEGVNSGSSVLVMEPY